jgi:hypothetical protein
MMRELAASLALISLVLSQDLATLAQSPTPGANGQLVVVPDMEIVVTFPGDWSVREPTPGEEDAMFASVRPDLRPLVRAKLLATADDAAALCLLVDQSDIAAGGSLELEALIPVAVGAYATATGWVPDVAIEELPFGDALRVEVRLRESVDISTHLMTDGRVWLYLQCASPRAPEDHWRSIAETIESLPTEE